MTQVIIEYKIQKNYCPCCRQKLENPAVSKEKTMEFNEETAVGWAPWDEIAEDPEEMNDMVRDFVRETIDFFAADLYDKIIVEDSEIEKVKSWIMSDIVAV